MTNEVPTTKDTYRFHLDKREFRVRYENETENEVDVVIEPKPEKEKTT